MMDISERQYWMKFRPYTWADNSTQHEKRWWWQVAGQRFVLAMIKEVEAGWEVFVWDFKQTRFFRDEASPYADLEHAKAVAEALVLLGD